MRGGLPAQAECAAHAFQRDWRRHCRRNAHGSARERASVVVKCADPLIEIGRLARERLRVILDRLFFLQRRSNAVRRSTAADCAAKG
jgi:hypothetical protein